MSTRRRATLHAIVLAAGASSRFGSPKHLVRFERQPLIQRVIAGATVRVVEFVLDSGVRGTENTHVLKRIVEATVLGVATAGKSSRHADQREGLRTALRVIFRKAIGQQRVLSPEGQ